ncbi:unnamed protein product [Rangifer tarandus platyrhynchus]|uniref:Uncharacterized protein n=2 Tax=Rangifer tarandus platyrhynchus TaxID=3082113 RepID=A0AC59YJK4_RANTA|nr:unnamed protein product [Rangifer tarandus platyrhynchus]
MTRKWSKELPDGGQGGRGDGGWGGMWMPLPTGSSPWAEDTVLFLLPPPHQHIRLVGGQGKVNVSDRDLIAGTG